MSERSAKAAEGWCIKLMAPFPLWQLRMLAWVCGFAWVAEIYRHETGYASSWWDALFFVLMFIVTPILGTALKQREQEVA